MFGFDYEKAENMRNSYNSKLSINENTPLNSNNDKKNNTYKLEQKIEKKIDAGISNKIRNVLSIAGRGVLLKSFNLICWPVSFAVGGAWSYKNIELDCLNILKIFEEAFTPLRFEVLKVYVLALLKAIEYLEYIGKKIIEDGNKKKQKKK